MSIAASLLLAGPTFAGDVEGVVYRDFNGNGAQDAGEPGVGGVVVEVFTASGGLGSTTTASDGSYTATGTAGGTDVRVEFTLPTSLDFLDPGVLGADSVGQASFLTLPGSGVNAVDIDLALVNPGQHCEASPTVTTACFTQGDGTGSDDVLISFPFTASVNTPAPSHEAIESQIGSVYGMAYQRSSDSLFVGAFQKRHSGYADGTSDGTGAIYRLSDPGD
ncbi:MAG: SdrD B-like domain-containing protein, partial [Acidobacteriota bacterium]